MTEGIIEILVANGTVQTLVGRNVANTKYKVYPIITPQSERPPYITVQMTSRTAVPCKEGRPTAFISTATVNLYTVNYDDCRDLSEAVADAVDGQMFIGADYSLTYIRHQDESESWIDSDGLGLYVRSITFEAHESTAT
jgi:hypothetical protein